MKYPSHTADGSWNKPEATTLVSVGIILAVAPEPPFAAI
jgi:hypothetical protein